MEKIQISNLYFFMLLCVIGNFSVKLNVSLHLVNNKLPVKKRSMNQVFREWLDNFQWT